MKLIDGNSYSYYTIKNFGEITEENKIPFYENGIIEGEIIKVVKDIKANKNIFFIEINNSLFSFKSQYAKEISIEEYNE